MLLRSSVTSTKKFFQKTLKNFKSLFSSTGYQRIPKSPSPYSVSAMNAKDTSDFSDQLEVEKEKESRRIKKKEAAFPSTTKHENEAYNEKKNEVGKTEEWGKKNNKRSLTLPNRKQKGSSFNSLRMRENRYFTVKQKLRELEMLDMSNVDHVLDIEEVLHYYSMLTCPEYLDIVDRFFFEMYSEFFGPVM